MATPQQAPKNTGGIGGFTSQHKIGAAKSKEFAPLKTGFTKGYRNREDQTMLPPDVLVAGSQNVLTDTAERVGIRKGYTLDGQSNSDLAPIAGSFDWQRHTGDIRNLRSGFNTTGSNGKLQFRYVANTGDIWDDVTLTAGQVIWMDILENLTSSNFNSDSFWDSTNLISLCLMVNGLSQIYAWSGAVASLAEVSTASGSIQQVSIFDRGSGFAVGDTINLTTAAGVITGLSTTPTAAGSGYTAGDTLSITSGGFRGICEVDTIGVGGAVLTLHLINAGDSYSAGSGKATNNGGSGSIQGASINTPGTGYKVGDTCLISGGTDGRIVINTINAGGIPTSIQVIAPGYGYSTGTDGTFAQFGSSGSGLTVDILASPGSGCTVNITSVNNFTGTNGQLKVASLYVNEMGVQTTGIGSVEISNPGIGYTQLASSNYQHSTSGSGINTTIFITSVTTGYIKIAGTKTLAQLGFFEGETSVIINGNTYTFSPLQNFDSFYITDIPGVTDPVGSVIVQSVQITPNSATSGLPADLANALITVLYGQVYIAALDNSSIYISKEFSYTDYTFSTPRKPGEGAIVTLDAPPVAFAPQEDTVYVSAGLSFWYLISFTLSADLTDETLTIDRLKTTELQGTQSQALTGKIKNELVFISNEPILNTLGPIPNILNVSSQPQTSDVSYSIVNDMNSYDFTDGSIIYFRQFVYFSVPKSGIVRVYNMTNPKNPYWEAPLILPIARFAIIDNALYGHSYLVGETYKLFDGWTDNGNAVEAIAKFAFDSDGVRSDTKSFNRYWVEGYIDTDTTLNLQIQYDLDGCATNVSYPIDGDDTTIVCSIPKDNSLGKSSLGKNPLGGALVLGDTLPPYFHVIQTFPRVPYFYQQTSFRSEGIGKQWYLLSFGGASSPTSEESNSITH